MTVTTTPGGLETLKYNKRKQSLITPQGINISHLGKRKIIFKYALSGGYVSSLEGTHLANGPWSLKFELYFSLLNMWSQKGLKFSHWPSKINSGYTPRRLRWQWKARCLVGDASSNRWVFHCHVRYVRFLEGKLINLSSHCTFWGHLVLKTGLVPIWFDIPYSTSYLWKSKDVMEEYGSLTANKPIKWSVIWSCFIHVDLSRNSCTRRMSRNPPQKKSNSYVLWSNWCVSTPDFRSIKLLFGDVLASKMVPFHRKFICVKSQLLLQKFEGS